MRSTWTRALAAQLAGFAFAVSAAEPPQTDPDAKTIYHNPESGRFFLGPDQKERQKSATIRPRPATGVHYWVNLVSQEDREGHKVDTRRVFHSGESIQLVIESNFDGYLAVLSMAPDGTAGLLFPDPRLGLTSNFVGAKSPTVVPGPGHFFRFEGAKGTERLFLIVAPSKGEMEQLHLSPKMEPQQIASLVQASKALEGAKNLVTASFAAEESSVGDVTVRLDGGSILQEIQLEHR